MNKHEVFMGCCLTEEQHKRNKEHYEEIKDKVEILGGCVCYGKHTYSGKVLDETLTADEVALICDQNLCFGYSGKIFSDRTFSIEVYTD